MRFLVAAVTALCLALSGCVSTPPTESDDNKNSSAVTVTVPSDSVSATTPDSVPESTPPPDDNSSSDVTSYNDNSSENETTTSAPPETPHSVSSSENETSPPAPETTTTTTTIPTTTSTTTVTEAEKPPAPVEPSPPYIVTPTADGVTVYQNDTALIDASNASEGYIMVKLKKPDDGIYKVVIDVSSISLRYTFTIKGDGSYTVLPITEGSGSYTVMVLKQVAAGKGATLLKQEINISISDEFAPFLTPTVNCTYDENSQCVKLSSELCGGKSELEKIEAVYEYVIDNIDYVSTAENAANGYVPLPDRTLKNKGGICYDYASLMAAMLRSQKIPTKVVAGYAGDIYHAWLSIYVTGTGWVDGIISFDGNKWNRMDPTFAAGATDENDYKDLIKYIQNNSNYSDVYYY